MRLFSITAEVESSIPTLMIHLQPNRRRCRWRSRPSSSHSWSSPTDPFKPTKTRYTFSRFRGFDIENDNELIVQHWIRCFFHTQKAQLCLTLSLLPPCRHWCQNAMQHNNATILQDPVDVKYQKLDSLAPWALRWIKYWKLSLVGTTRAAITRIRKINR